MNAGLPLIILAASRSEGLTMTPKAITNLLMIGLILFALMSLQVKTPKTDDLDPRDAAAIAHKVPGTIAALQAEVYADCVRQLRDGTLKTETAAAEFLSKQNKAAISAAFRPLDEHLQSVLGEGKWTAETAAKTYEAIGQGLQKAGAK